MTRLVAKLVMLILLCCAFFVAYSLSAPYFQRMLGSTNRVPSSSVAMAGLQGLSMALVWGLVFALPLAWFWGRLAFLAALVCVAPVILITWFAYSQQHRPSSTLLAFMLFVVSLAVIVPVFAQAAHFALRRWSVALRGSVAPANAVRSSSSSDRVA
jgi:hypothetical protein